MSNVIQSTPPKETGAMIGAQKAVIVFYLEIIVSQLRKLGQDPLLSAVDRSNRNEHPFAWTSGSSLTEDQAS